MNTDRDADLIGGRFRVHERLGAGGMAAVYRATDTRLDRDVAVKLVDLRTDLDGDARDRILREARRAAKLRHPNIVQVHDVGVDDGHAYIVMEHIDGPTLAQLRDRRGQLPEHQVAGLGVQICQALQAAHDAGIIHRDVKPGNILLDDGRVKVTDFGIARAAGDTVTDEQLRGTIAYLAPEQLNGSDVDHRADLYTLGIVLYELATGDRPFDGATATETAMRRLHTDPPAPSDRAAVSTEYDQLTATSLAPDPDRRFQTARELQTALEPLTVDPTVDTQPLAGTPPPADPDRSSSDRRRRGGLVAGGLVGLLLAAAALLIGPQLLTGGSGPVPDVTGSTVRAAANLLEQHGLQVGEVTPRVSDRPEGTVIAQDPPAGADAPAGGTVDLIVAQAAPSTSPSPTASDSPTSDPKPASDQQPADRTEQQEQPQDEPQEEDPGRGPDGQGPPGQDGQGPPGRG